MAPADDDISIEEKRVYAGSAGRTDAYVATGAGVVRVALSADKVGSFGMIARAPANDVAVCPRDGADLLGVATDDGLRIAPIGDDPTFESVGPPESGGPVGDGPAVAVGVHGDAFIVAGADGRVDRVAFGGQSGDEDYHAASPEAGATGPDGDVLLSPMTTDVGKAPDPRAVDGPLVAAADGVYRVTETDGADGATRAGTVESGDETGDGVTLVSVGLDDACDVAGAGVPLGATATGLYWLGNGWMSAHEGNATAVAADGNGHAMAVVDSELLVHGDETVNGTEPRSGDDRDAVGWCRDSWIPTTLPVAERPVALGYGPGVAVVVTDGGTLCVDAGDGWRQQIVGVRDVTGVALTAVE